MHQVVYIDVLFFINLIVNYFILLASSRILHRDDKRLRLFLGAVLGAVYSLLIFYPPVSYLYCSVLKFLFSIIIVLVSFKAKNIVAYIKLLICFYLVSIVFGGIMFALYLFLSPPGLFIRNGVLYMDISPVVLILTSCGCYFVIKLFSRFLHRNIETEKIYTVEIELNKVKVKADAMLDTGNSLCDAITGMPVMIAEYASVEKLIPMGLRTSFQKGVVDDPELFRNTNWKGRLRMIPYQSVGSTGGLLPAFRPDKVTASGKDQIIETTNVLVAVSRKKLSDSGGYHALLNPNMFREIHV